MVVRRGQILRIGWVIKTLEAQVGQLIMGCKCPVSKKKAPLVTFPPRFSFKMSFNCTSRDEFGPFEDNQSEGCRLDPKKSRQELFQRIFALGIFWGGVRHYATTPLIVALSPGHSDTTRFHPWSPIVIGNHWRVC